MSMNELLARIERLDRTTLAAGGIVLSVILFLAVTIAANLSLGSARVDLTEDRLFTLSRGTYDVLAHIDEPLTIRFYQSKDAEKLGTFVSTQSKRVNELLKQYARLSGDKIKVERYDPQPFSPEEDLAVGDGLRGIAIGAESIQVYFGLAGVNSTDDVDAIPFLSPDRADFLEYDLTRMVYNLSHPEKPIVAVIGDLPLRGTQQNNFRPWVVLEQAQQLYDIRMMGGTVDLIPDDASILLLAQPMIKDEKTLYAIDQFVMRGGRVLAFVDPVAEILDVNMVPGRAPKQTAAADIDKLLASWGVSMTPDRVVGDRQLGRQVQATDKGRPIVAPYIAWITVEKQNMNANDVITAGIQRINLRSPGAIRPRPGATTRIEPIILTTPDVMEVLTGKVQTMPNVGDLLAEFQPTGQPMVLAARVTGPVKSAFPDGPPAAVEKEDIRAAHLKEGKTPLNLLLFGDADMLTDAVWVQVQSMMGQRSVSQIANNGDLFMAALDNLSGSEGLLGLRGRGLSLRPFVVLQQMEEDAQLRFRAKERELQKKIEDTQTKIEEMQQREQRGGVLLTAEQQKEIEKFRSDMLDLRQELRGVQRALRQDVERLGSWLRALNIWAVPLLVGLVAMALAGLRRARASRFQASIQH
ncbi:MAG: ABC transporter [Alphaproteobacteria bacterium]|nr:ABC transporter [Alphaproteobacteria bacterium]